MSLPRSYTLPREFKYYRRNKGRKLIKNEHFITSTNSSDGMCTFLLFCFMQINLRILLTGDVDSGDDNESEQYSNQSSARRMNNSQRRQRPPIAAAPSPTNLRNNYHNHQPSSSSPIVTAVSPVSHQHPPYKQHNLHTVVPSTAAAPCMPNYMNITNNPSTSNSNKLNLNGFDLISGVVDNTSNNNNSSGNNFHAPLNRQMRLRVYGNAKGGMVRHETKL